MDDLYILLTWNIGLLVLFHFNLQSQELNMKLFIYVFDVYITPTFKKICVFFSSYEYLFLHIHTGVQYPQWPEETSTHLELELETVVRHHVGAVI